MKGLWTPAWIARHVLALVLIAGCLGLGWWQFSRATGGNALSWGYTFEWPVFAGFVAFLWWREVQLARRGRADRPAGSRARRRAGTAPGAPVTVGRPVRVAGPGRRPPRTTPSWPPTTTISPGWPPIPAARPADYPGHLEKK